MVDSSTQVPDHDHVKEEHEDKKTPKKEIKTEPGTFQESPGKGNAAEATPTMQDPQIKEEVEVKEDVPATVPDGASFMDLERGIEKPTEASHQAEVLSPILSSRVPRPRTAPVASLAPGEPSALMRPVAPSPQVRLFQQLDTRVAAPTLLHKLLPDPDLGLNSLLKFEGPLKEVHDANYNGVSTTGDYAGKFRNRILFMLIKILACVVAMKMLFPKSNYLPGLVDGNSSGYPSVLADPMIALRLPISADRRNFFALGLELVFQDFSRWMSRSST